jgi:uncharacterized protein HemX
VTEPITQAPPAAHSRHSRSRVEATAQVSASAFVPALLLALAFVLWLAFQAVQLVREQQQLNVATANLQSQSQVATKLRTALDALATSTAKLAADGNANARVIVDELRKRGVTINPNPPGPATKPQ